MHKNKPNRMQAFWPQHFQMFQTTMPIMLGLAHLEIIASLEAFMVDSVPNGWVKSQWKKQPSGHILTPPSGKFLKTIKTIVSIINKQ